ncbi:MAG: DUF4105 domain-containing protein [Nitrospiria bacterium]
MFKPVLLVLITFILNVMPNALVLAAEPDTSGGRLSPQAEIFLVTVGPGDLVWERFGHNGLVIRDKENGFNRLYHWGLFSFQSKNFWPRYIRGEMLYAMGSIAADAFVQFNVQHDRNVYVQKLNLNPAQKNKLAHFLMENDTDENRTYRYDYYLDNCSTRVRDAIDRVLGGLISESLQGRETVGSFRSHTRRLLQDLPAAYFASQLVLGNPGDRDISVWEETFTPMALRRHLNTIAFEDGSPLVLSDQQLFHSKNLEEPMEIKSFLLIFLSIGLLFGLLFAGLGQLSAKGRGWSRVGLGLLGSLWGLFSGLLGALLLLGWLFTEHKFWYWNENLFQYNPLLLGLAFYFPDLLFRGRLSRRTLHLSITIAALSIVGLLLQALPGLDQVNGEVIALTLPIHVGLAWAASRTQSSPG